ITRMQRDMKRASDAQEYERAGTLRDRIVALENVLEKSAVVLADGVDTDVFGIAHDELAAAVQQFVVRGGRIRGVHSWVVDKELDLDLPELVESVLQKAYGDDVEPPRRVIVPALPDDAAEIEHWLTARRWEISGTTGKVALSVAKRGDLATLAQTVDTNAKNALILYKTRRSGDFVARSQALSDLQEALGMPEAPLRMECYDVSHLSGTNIVASMVVFEDGLPRKDQYRRFSIPESRDDTESIYQTLSRRLNHIDDDLADETVPELTAAPEIADTPKRRFAYRPNLLIVDGGQPQVQAAARALAERGITDIALCGIA